MQSIKDLLSNYVLIVAISSWLAAQVLKTILTLLTTKKLQLERLTGAGGMPSAHSAAVCSMCIAISRVEGVASPLFALSFIFAAIVMYDAMGVRRAAGEHAKVINAMVKESRSIDIQNQDLLKEYLGHTPLEVLGGVLLGILMSMMIPVIH